MKLIKWFAGLMAMLLMLCAGAALASGADGTELYWSVETLPTVTMELPYDNDQLFTSYARAKLYGRPLNAFQTARRTLTDLEKEVYDYIVGRAALIADGTLTSTEMSYTVTNQKTVYFASDLGFEPIVNGAFDTPRISAAMDEIFAPLFDAQRLLSALSKDHPYEFYWLSNQDGTLYSLPFMGYYGGFGTNPDNGQYESYIEIGDTFTFMFPVDVEYVGTTLYSTNGTVTGAVTNALVNANRIIAGGTGKSDYDRLLYYAEQLRELSEYNHDAAKGYVSQTGPWQMIWALDGDPDTKVVCEGFSEAFQYLCDNTTFISTDLEVSTVTGKMNGGLHEWNVVHTTCGNYIADVTNYDRTNPMGGLFFQVPTSGDYINGYKFGNNSYVYTESYYPASVLELATDEYDPDAEPTPGPTQSPTPTPEPTATPSPTPKPTATPTLAPTPKPLTGEITLVQGDTLALYDENWVLPSALMLEEFPTSLNITDGSVIDFGEDDTVVTVGPGVCSLILTAPNSKAVITVTVVAELPTFTLPEDLIELDTEALSGTAAVRLVLPDGFSQASDDAFDGMTALKQILVADASQVSLIPQSSKLLYLCYDADTAATLASAGLIYLVLVK